MATMTIKGYRVVLSVMTAGFLFFACGEDVKPNRVELEQIEIDGSTNDRYLFRKEIEKERERKKRFKKKENF